MQKLLITTFLSLISVAVLSNPTLSPTLTPTLTPTPLGSFSSVIYDTDLKSCKVQINISVENPILESTLQSFLQNLDNCTSQTNNYTTNCTHSYIFTSEVLGNDSLEIKNKIESYSTECLFGSLAICSFNVISVDCENPSSIKKTNAILIVVIVAILETLVLLCITFSYLCYTTKIRTYQTVNEDENL